MTAAFPHPRTPLRTRPTVTVRRRVRPRPTVDLTRLTRYRGGTYSHTVDTIVFSRRHHRAHRPDPAQSQRRGVLPGLHRGLAHQAVALPGRHLVGGAEPAGPRPRGRSRLDPAELLSRLRNRRTEPPTAGGGPSARTRPTSASTRRSPRHRPRSGTSPTVWSSTTAPSMCRHGSPALPAPLSPNSTMHANCPATPSISLPTGRRR